MGRVIKIILIIDDEIKIIYLFKINLLTKIILQAI